MKNLLNEDLQKLQGGILCSQIPAVMSYLLQNNPDQYHYNLVTYSMFGHGGTVTLQCDEE
ncbi:hypothetical protein [Haliscomenobacter sp.]|uniref:hypothetical protein n=1 Tax=Haliscomenobacter sp. TaxID=2717303 RepID=UPI0033652341